MGLSPNLGGGLPPDTVGNARSSHGDVARGIAANLGNEYSPAPFARSHHAFHREGGLAPALHHLDHIGVDDAAQVSEAYPHR